MIFTRAKRKTQVLEAIIKSLEARLKFTTDFLEGIANFDLNAESRACERYTHDDVTLNDLVTRASRRLMDYAGREAERKWVADGMTQFMNILGKGKTDNDEFYDSLLKLMVQYTEGNQGGLFLLNDDDPQDHYLEMKSCFAYGRKRSQETRVEIGEGMLGQCYLEKERICRSEIPQYYTKITSGLGEATPTFMLLLPLQYNDIVIGVMELAYFKRPEQYKIEFAEKIAENIASVTLNRRHARRAEALYAESQLKAKALHTQEEALRRNVDQLLITQETMKQKQIELDRQSALLKFIVDNIPFPIFVKDHEGRYTIVNAAESRLFNLADAEILGKDDSHFVTSMLEWEVIHESDQRVLSGNEPVELPLQNFTTKNGNSFIFKTTKIPFLNPITGKKNILGVSIDLTERLTLERNLHVEKTINKNHIFINIAGRQRMLSQRIAYYCETIIRGKIEHAGVLREAIELHDHTLQVLRNGGFPIGIDCESALEPLQQELMPWLESIEDVWEVYKNASENILSFTSVELDASNSPLNNQRNIATVEEFSELLLNKNNELLNAFIAINQRILSEVV